MVKILCGPSDVLFPVPAALIVSGLVSRPNIITVAWIGMMGSKPPFIAISLKKDRYSLGLIRDSGEFTVNIPSCDQFKRVDFCGLVSGKDRNKFEDANFTPIKSAKIKTPIILECPYNIECKVACEVDLGEWVAIFGEIVETHVDDDKIDKDSGKIDVSKIRPLVYCATIREYWELGRKLGDGFSSGKDLMHISRLDKQSKISP